MQAKETSGKPVYLIILLDRKLCNSVRFKFIYVALLTMVIVANKFYRIKMKEISMKHANNVT